MKVNEEQPQSTKDGTHKNGITQNCGVKLNKNKNKNTTKKNPKTKHIKNHQNVKDQIYYLSKLGGKNKSF